MAKLCEATVNRRGLHAVVTINYDSLLRAGAQRGTDTGQIQTHLEIGGEALAEEKGHFPRAWLSASEGERITIWRNHVDGGAVPRSGQ